MLRFDSLSKILSAGIRIGFASGPEPLLDAMDRHVRLYCTGLDPGNFHLLLESYWFLMIVGGTRQSFFF